MIHPPVAFVAEPYPGAAIDYLEDPIGFAASGWVDHA
jgi:hypothetical protein